MEAFATLVPKVIRFIPLVDDLRSRLSISIQWIARKVCVTLLALTAVSVPKLFNAIYGTWVTGLSFTLKSRAIYLRHHVVPVVAEVPFFVVFSFLKVFLGFFGFLDFFLTGMGLVYLLLWSVSSLTKNLEQRLVL